MTGISRFRHRQLGAHAFPSRAAASVNCVGSCTMKWPLRALAAATALPMAATTAWAGMPSPFVMTEIGRMRLESLSFFLILFFLSAGLIQLLWNYLRRDFT